MARTTVLDLPTELLQDVFEYLDWDRSKDLTPVRPQIINISATCWHLRKAVLPLLFRNVSLKLRWAHGALIQPGMFSIRQQCPHLAKYVKCIHVETLFGHYKELKSSMSPFALPKELQQWMDSIATLPSDTGNIVYSSESDIVTNLAERLLDTPQCIEFLQHARQDVQTRFRHLAYSLSDQALATPLFSTTETDVRREPRNVIGDENFFDDAREEANYIASTQRNVRAPSKGRDVRFLLDAFFVLLLCFPSQVNSLVFESLPTDRMDVLQGQFALQLASLIFRIYGGHLERLTMTTSAMRTSPNFAQDEPSTEAQRKIIGDVLGDLDAVRYLTLTGNPIPHRSGISVQKLGYWHTLAEKITHLDLRSADGDTGAFIDFIGKFTNLQHLSLGQLALIPPRMMNRPARHSYASVWLSFLIELRRKLPAVEFGVYELNLGSRYFVSVSGVRWLLEEAVPKGAKLDFERETRLTEDFESLIFLWATEDSDRGQAAREARKDGKLVDLAMSSRWRGLYTGGKH